MGMKRMLPDIGAMLREGHFGSLDSEMPPPADPVTVTQMVLEIALIEPYDRNPRQEANPRYDEIKESIRAQRGLNNALEITRRPGAEHYMIRAGGNTRLRILKELFAETGDAAFSKVHCLFHPWTSDADVLTAHMIENELRGEMSLIDKALGLQALKVEIESQSGSTLSSRDLVRKLAESGYTISRRHLARFQYAAEILYPLIPTALRSGMGQPQIDALRAMENSFRSYWSDAGREPDRFQTVWKDALLMIDGPEFDVANARQGLESRVAGLLGHPVSRIRIAVDALLSGRRETKEDPDDGEDSTPQVAPGGPDVSLALQPSVSGGEPALPEPNDERSAAASGSASPLAPVPSHTTRPGTSDLRSAPGSTSPIAQQESPEPEAATADSGPAFEPAAYTGPTDLKSLRARNYVLSLQIAQRSGLGAECIRKLPTNGLGYLVDLPTEPVIGKSREETLRRWLWWFLFSLSEFYTDQDRAVYMIEKQITPADYLERDGKTFVGTPPDVSLLVRQLLSSPLLPDRDFHALCQLMESCRMARRLCPDKDGEALWKQFYDGREAQR